jgi:hypothetical protein
VCTVTNVKRVAGIVCLAGLFLCAGPAQADKLDRLSHVSEHEIERAGGQWRDSYCGWYGPSERQVRCWVHFNSKHGRGCVRHYAWDSGRLVHLGAPRCRHKPIPAYHAGTMTFWFGSDDQ